MTISAAGSTRAGVVFVSHHSEALVAPAAAVYRQAGFVIRVVDNSGTYPPGGHHQELLRPGANVGFGRGCNLGVASLPPSVGRICFHNPDVAPSVDALRRLCGVLDAVPEAGAVAPVEADGEAERIWGYSYPSPARELYLALRFRRRMARPAPGRPQAARPAAPRRSTDGVQPKPGRFPAFAFVVVDRVAFEAIGGFDENYFLYAEDLDLWHRLRLAGRPGLFDPTTAVDHRGGQSSPVAGPTREVLRWIGVELFAERFSRFGWRPYRVVHSLALRTYPPEPVAGRLHELWRRGLRPTAVAGAIRDDVEAGRLALSG